MKKVVALVLALAMLILSHAVVAENGIDPWKPYEDTVEVSFVRGINIAGDAVDYTYESPLNTKLKEELNIQITYDWVTTVDQYDTRVALALASGKVPDVMQVNLTTLRQMYDADMLVNLTDAFNTYATAHTKRMMGYSDGTAQSFKLATINGALYGIPNYAPVLETMQTIWLRTDWLKNLSLDIPKSFAELETILYAFAQKDPDGNGQDDTYGFGINKNLYGTNYVISSVANMMHAYPNAWVRDQAGSVVYGSVQPEMKSVLETLARWFRDGLIDPEFTVKDAYAQSQLVIEGRLGAASGGYWIGNEGGAFKELWASDPESDWQAVGIAELSIDEEAAKPIVYDSSSTFYVVTKECEHPEAVVKMLNFAHKFMSGDSEIYLKDDYDGHSTDYWQSPEQYAEYVSGKWSFFPIIPDSIHGNVRKWQAVGNTLLTGDEKSVSYCYNTYNTYRYVDTYLNEDPATRIGDDISRKSQIGQYYVYSLFPQNFMLAVEYAEKDLLTYDIRGALVTKTMADSLSILNKLEIETFTRIITGEGSIDEFDDFVSQWNLLGGAEMTDEMNAYYAAQ